MSKIGDAEKERYSGHRYPELNQDNHVVCID
jgi:hypothetical protein